MVSALTKVQKNLCPPLMQAHCSFRVSIHEVEELCLRGKLWENQTISLIWLTVKNDTLKSVNSCGGQDSDGQELGGVGHGDVKFLAQSFS